MSLLWQFYGYCAEHLHRTNIVALASGVVTAVSIPALVKRLLNLPEHAANACWRARTAWSVGSIEYEISVAKAKQRLAQVRREALTTIDETNVEARELPTDARRDRAGMKLRHTDYEEHLI